jgi:hypothetical protein
MTENSPIFSKPTQDPNKEDSAELSMVVALLLESLPRHVDPSVMIDRLVETGLLRRWLDPLYGEILYVRTVKGKHFLERLEKQLVDEYPDTGETGDTYNVELEASHER